MKYLVLEQTDASTLDTMLYGIASAHVSRKETQRYAGHVENAETGEQALKLPAGDTFLLSEKADIEAFAAQVGEWLDDAAAQEVRDAYKTNKGSKVVLADFLPSAVQDQIYTREELEAKHDGWFPEPTL